METSHSSRLCDFCCESTALVYCKADSAKLCFVCDRQVHSTNQLFTKHTRWLLCDSCDSTSATIFCFTDTSVLCQNCDWEAHSNRSLSAVHDRRPLEGFSGCPSVTELLGILGFEDLGKKQLLIGGGGGGGDDDTNYGGKVEEQVEGHDVEYIYGLSDFLDWEPPSVMNLDDVLSSNSIPAQHKFETMRVPTPPKNRNATCGVHKEEILCQLREMSKLEPEFDGDVEPLAALLSEEIIHTEQKEIAPKLDTSYEAEGFQIEKAANYGFSSNLEMNNLVPDVGENSSSGLVVKNGVAVSCEEQCVPIGVGTFQMLPQLPIREPMMNTKERDSAISRYKEKKKTRRYEKHIRYESRKIRAASRTRIKGRFAKMDG